MNNITMPLLNKVSLTKPNHLTVTAISHHSGKIAYNPWSGALSFNPGCVAGTIICHIANSDPRDIGFGDYIEAYSIADVYNFNPRRTVYIPKYKPLRDVFTEDMPDIKDGKYWVAEEWYTAIPLSGEYATIKRDWYYNWVGWNWNINKLRDYNDPKYNKSGYDVWKDLCLRYSEDLINMRSPINYTIEYKSNITAPTINSLAFYNHPKVNNDKDDVRINHNTIHLYHITFKEKEYLEDHPELGIIYYIIPNQKPINNISYTPVKRRVG